MIFFILLQNVSTAIPTAKLYAVHLYINDNIACNLYGIVGNIVIVYCYYSSTTSTAPSATVSPLATEIDATFPSRSALMLFSIFIASKRTTV